MSLYEPVTHPDAVSVQGHYKAMLWRFERKYQRCLERDELIPERMAFCSAMLLVLRRLAR